MLNVNPYANQFVPLTSASQIDEMPLDATERARLTGILQSNFTIPTLSGQVLQIPVAAFLRDFSLRIGASRQGIFGSSVAQVINASRARDVDVYFVLPRLKGAMDYAEAAFSELTHLWGATMDKRIKPHADGLFLGVEGLDLVILYEDCQLRTHTSDDEELRIEVKANEEWSFWGQDLSLQDIENRKDQVRANVCVFTNPQAVYGLFFRLLQKERKNKYIHEIEKMYVEGGSQLVAMPPERLARNAANLLKHYDKPEHAAVLYKMLERAGDQFDRLLLAMPDTDDTWLQAMKAHPENAQVLWQLRAGEAAGSDCTERAKDTYRQLPDLEKPSYLRKIAAPWFTDTAWLQRQRHVCVLLEKGEQPKKLKMDAWLAKAENLPEEPLHRAAWKWFLEQQLPVPKSEGEHLAVARAVVIAQLPVTLRPDLQGLDAEQLGELAAAEGQSDPLAQLEHYYNLRKSPALHAWLQHQGALEVEALAKKRFAQDPALLRQLSWWCDETFIESAQWKILCQDYENCPIQADLLKLGQKALAAYRFVKVGSASWSLLQYHVALHEPFRKYLLTQIASWIVTDCEELEGIMNTLTGLKDLGLIEEVRPYKLALQLDWPSLLAQKPSLHTAFVAALFYEAKLKDAMLPHLLEGYKLALAKGGTGKRFADLLGDAAKPAAVLSSFAEQDPVFALAFASKVQAELGSESFPVMWQLARNSLADFLPYFKRCLPTQAELATLPVSAASLELFILAAQGELDSKAHMAMVRKGAYAEHFIALQTDIDALFELLSVHSSLYLQVQERVIASGSPDFALKLLAQSNSCNLLPFIRNLQQANTYDAVFWNEAVLLIKDAESLVAVLERFEVVSCQHLVYALKVLSSGALNKLLSQAAGSETEDYEPLIRAVLQKQKEKGVSALLGFACSKRAGSSIFSKFYPLIADALEGALWNAALTPPEVIEVLKRVLAAPSSKRDVPILAAALAYWGKVNQVIVEEAALFDILRSSLIRKLQALLRDLRPSSLTPLLFAACYQAILAVCDRVYAGISVLEEPYATQQRLHGDLQDVFCDVAPYNPAFMLKDFSVVQAGKTLEVLTPQISSSQIFRYLYRKMVHLSSLRSDADAPRGERFHAVLDKLVGFDARSPLLKFFLDQRISRLGVEFDMSLGPMQFDMDEARKQEISVHLSILVREYCEVRVYFDAHRGIWEENAFRRLQEVQQKLIQAVRDANLFDIKLKTGAMQRLFFVLTRPDPAFELDSVGDDLGQLLLQVVDSEVGPDENFHVLLASFLKKLKCANVDTWDLILNSLRPLVEDCIRRTLLTKQPAREMEQAGLIFSALCQAAKPYMTTVIGEMIRGFLTSLTGLARTCMQIATELAKAKKAEAGLPFAPEGEDFLRLVPQLAELDAQARLSVTLLWGDLAPLIDPPAFEEDFEAKMAAIKTLEYCREGLLLSADGLITAGETARLVNAQKTFDEALLVFEARALLCYKKAELALLYKGDLSGLHTVYDLLLSPFFLQAQGEKSKKLLDSEQVNRCKVALLACLDRYTLWCELRALCEEKNWDVLPIQEAVVERAKSQDARIRSFWCDTLSGILSKGATDFEGTVGRCIKNMTEADSRACLMKWNSTLRALLIVI